MRDSCRDPQNMGAIRMSRPFLGPALLAMDPRFRHMGVAVMQGRKRGHFYWVQNQGAPAR